MACTSALHPASSAVHFPPDEKVEYYHLLSYRPSNLQIIPRDKSERDFEGGGGGSSELMQLKQQLKITRTLSTNDDTASLVYIQINLII